MIVNTGTLQLVLYPVISSVLTIERFGNVLTIMGLVNVISVVFGGSLNNTQLIDRKFYKSNTNFFGDFKTIYSLYLFPIILFSLFLLSLPFFSLSIIERILIILLIVLTSIRSYLPVYWRIDLEYNFILKHSVITALGYLAGCILVKLNNDLSWVWAFILGELFSMIYLFAKTGFLKVEFKKSKNLKKVNTDFINLMSSNIVANIMTYFDRFVLQALIGSKEVSIFFAASIFGKLTSIVLQPISGVILSHLSRQEDKNQKRYFAGFVTFSLVSGLLLFIVSLLLSPFLVKILYSNLYGEAKGIMNLANLSAILLVMGSLLQPLLLKFLKLYWQNIIQIIYALVFAVLGYWLTKEYRLTGFVYASLISNAVRYISFLLIGYFKLWRKNHD